MRGFSNELSTFPSSDCQLPASSSMDKQALFKPLSALTSKNEKSDRKNGTELHERIASGDGEKKELRQRDAMQYLGYSWSTWRKWQIL